MRAVPCQGSRLLMGAVETALSEIGFEQRRQQGESISALSSRCPVGRARVCSSTMSEPAENSEGTVRRIGKPFPRGVSGNPGGRPKGIARTVRERCGGGPTKLVDGLLAIAEGEGLNGKPVREADRIRAYELLLAYGWVSPRLSCQSKALILLSRTKWRRRFRA
jgi:hypothetical protein